MECLNRAIQKSERVELCKRTREIFNAGTLLA